MTYFINKIALTFDMLQKYFAGTRLQKSHEMLANLGVEPGARNRRRRHYDGALIINPFLLFEQVGVPSLDTLPLLLLLVVILYNRKHMNHKSFDSDENSRA